MEIQFLGAAGGVTGSCYLIRNGAHHVLLECGQIQGGEEEEQRNREPLPIPAEQIDAVVLSHAHIDHSGRLPLLARLGFSGPIHTHQATTALCDIMLRDSAYLHEKDAEWENRKRERRGLPPLKPLFTRADAEAVLSRFEGMEYGVRRTVAPGIDIRLNDAGHILGAAIVELWLSAGGVQRKIVFSGDLGFRDAPIMADPSRIAAADLVLLESTYGDRLHRSFDATLQELAALFEAARGGGGNLLIPAFAIGRTQDLLYLMAQYYEEWQLADWRVFLDSPMAIRATGVYWRYRHLLGARVFREGEPILPNITATRSSTESMAINKIHSGAIVIAGSGMCNGGRIVHHLKHNLWRPECHVVIVGFQADGTLGRQLVDGAEYVRLWHEEIRVNASIHTVGGLSAHADQAGLLKWYGDFENRPPVVLVHGEPAAQARLAERLRSSYGATVKIPRLGERLSLDGDLVGACAG